MMLFVFPQFMLASWLLSVMMILGGWLLKDTWTVKVKSAEAAGISATEGWSVSVTTKLSSPAKIHQHHAETAYKKRLLSARYKGGNVLPNASLFGVKCKTLFSSMVISAKSAL